MEIRTEYFEKLASIKKDVINENKNQKGFEISKGLLNSFSEYLSSNKLAVYAVLGLSLLNAASNVAKQSNINYDNLFSGQSTIAQELITNKNFNESLPQLTGDAINKVFNGDIKGSTVFKNPFWKGNIITLEVAKDGKNMLQHEELHKEIKVDLHNAIYLVDHGNYKISLNEKEIEDFASTFEMKSSMKDFKQYAVLHESAHASFKQNMNYNKAEIIAFTESHADLTSLMYYAKHNDMNKFNNLIDDVISFRVEGMKNSDFSHNSIYSLLEFKNLINKNPSLLKLQDDKMADFTFDVVKNINNKDFKNDITQFLSNHNISIDSQDFVKDMKNIDNTSSLTKILYEYAFPNKNSLAKFVNMNADNDFRLNKLGEKMSDEVLNKSSDSHKYINLLYSADKENFKSNLTNLYKDIQAESKIDKSIVEDVKQDIFYQKIDFSSTSKDERINNYINNFKYNI